MKKIEILVFGKHPDILATVLRLINGNEHWTGEGSGDEEEIIAMVQTKSYDILLLGGGIDHDVDDEVRAAARTALPDIKVIQHFGGGSGLLASEIITALSADSGTNFNISSSK